MDPNRTHRPGAGPEMPTPPPPMLSQRKEAQLSARHREVLDALEEQLLANGFADVTVGELAERVGCSRRTLYQLAASKDELVLTVIDRFLHRVGRTALDAMEPDATAVTQLRQYFLGGVELHRWTEVITDDMEGLAAAQRLVTRHFRYVTRVVQHLVQAAVEAGEIRPVRPGLVAGVLTGSALFFSRPGVVADLGIPLGRVTEELLNLVLDALVANA